MVKWPLIKPFFLDLLREFTEGFFEQQPRPPSAPSAPSAPPPMLQRSFKDWAGTRNSKSLVPAENSTKKRGVEAFGRGQSSLNFTDGDFVLRRGGKQRQPPGNTAEHVRRRNYCVHENVFSSVSTFRFLSFPISLSKSTTSIPSPFPLPHPLHPIIQSFTCGQSMFNQFILLSLTGSYRCQRGLHPSPGILFIHSFTSNWDLTEKFTGGVL